MAAKSTTNNSTIVNLEEQGALISRVLEEGGVVSPNGSESSGSSLKTISKKKSRKVGQTTSTTSKSASVMIDSSAPADVTRPAVRRPNKGGEATPSAAAAAGAALKVPDGTVNQPRLLSNEPGNQDADAALGAGHAQRGGGDAVDFVGQMADWSSQQHQQWLWQQQAQAFPFAYGNFMPGFPLGAAYAPPDWEEEPQMVPQDPQVGAIRQKTHEISDDDEETDSASGQEVEPQDALPAREAVPKTVGTMADLAKEQLAFVKDSDRVAAKINPDLARVLESYLKDSTAVADMDKLAKQYPRVENVEGMKVPKLDEEVFQVVDQRHKTLDQNFQGIQKAILGSMSALADIMDLGFRRGVTDPELDALGRNLMDSMQLHAFAHNALSGRRRELLRPQLSPAYAKEMTKGQTASAEWLYGGELADATKKCDTAKKIGEKISRRKTTFPGSRPPMKKFRPMYNQQPGQQGFPMMRAFNPYPVQQFRFPAPQQMQFQAPYQPFGFGGFQRRQRPRQANPQQQQKQGFAKRGGFKR